MLHDKLIISVMLCFYQDILVNVNVLRLNTSIQQFIRPNDITMVLLTRWSHTSQVCSNVSTQGDKHTIHNDRRATCHWRMRTLHPKNRASLRAQDRIPWRWDHASPSHRSMITNMNMQNSWWDFMIPSQATLRLITVCFISSMFLFIHSMPARFGWLTIH